MLFESSLRLGEEAGHLDNEIYIFGHDQLLMFCKRYRRAEALSGAISGRFGNGFDLIEKALQEGATLVAQGPGLTLSDPKPASLR